MVYVAKFADTPSSPAAEIIGLYLKALKKILALDLDPEHGEMLNCFLITYVDYLVGSERRKGKQRGGQIVSRTDDLPLIGYMLR